MNDLSRHPLIVGIAIVFFGWISFQVGVLNREMGEVKTTVMAIEKTLAKIDKRMEKLEAQQEKVTWALFNGAE